jgi:hypothetical protein
MIPPKRMNATVLPVPVAITIIMVMVNIHPSRVTLVWRWVGLVVHVGWVGIDPNMIRNISNNAKNEPEQEFF